MYCFMSSFHVLLLRFICVDWLISNLFPFYCWTVVLKWICQNSLIHFLQDGHFGFFQFRAITNNAALNILVQVFLWTSIFISLGEKKHGLQCRYIWHLIKITKESDKVCFVLFSSPAGHTQEIWWLYILTNIWDYPWFSI